MPPDEFDWSLGAEDVDLSETTSVGERGAQDAEPNRLSVRDELGASEQGADDGDGSGDAADDGVAAQPAADEGDGQVDAEEGEAGGDDADAPESEHGLILGKFKSVDDLAEAYRNAEQRLGAQGTEVGQLRRDLDEMRGTLNAQTSQAPLNDELVSQVDDLAMQNPQAAAAWTLENQPALYNRVMQTWAASDPLSASRFETALMREQLKQEMDEQMQERYGPVAATVTEATQAAQFDTAWRTVATRHPDLTSLANAMMDAAAAAPELAAALQSGDVPSKERLIDNLYWLAKGRQADDIAAAATDLGRKQQQQASAEKRQAAVASGSSAQARGEKTNIESWKEQFLEAPSTSVFANMKSQTP